jgi:transcriptional regulator with XRE-family HTH domain
MESKELRFKHIGLASDGAVIFCEMENGKTYSMPLDALERAENWNPDAKPERAGIIHDGYAAFVTFDTGEQIDFPSDFVLHVCEPSYGYHRGKHRAASGVGGRIREIRRLRGLTLESLAARSGIAKPNLSRLENDKVTPTFQTLQTVARALDTHPALLVLARKPEHAWTWTRYSFTEWKQSLRWDETVGGSQMCEVSGAELVSVFLATRPEHQYALKKLRQHCKVAAGAENLRAYTVDAEKWACAKEIANGMGALGRSVKRTRSGV